MTIAKRNIRLNTAAHNPARETFLDALNAASRREGWRSYETMGYFLEAGYRALRRATLISQADIDKNEAAYMSIVKRCRTDAKETMADLSKMLYAVVEALEAAPVDFIGPVFEEVSASNFMGQFFTPYALSKLIAEMTMTQLPDGDEVLFCSEPACGVGGMVLAATEVLRGRGFDVPRKVHWQMVDVDSRVIAGAYIQVTLCGISADVIHGNTLSLETWEGTRTFAAMMHPKRQRERVLISPPSPEVVKIDMGPQPTIQGDLFA